MTNTYLVRQVIESEGLPVEGILAEVARGTFGSPSFFIGEELFFGKDTMELIEEEIAFYQAEH
jgi:2-hydroxychromene-2-carboxylate isomerase